MNRSTGVLAASALSYVLCLVGCGGGTSAPAPTPNPTPSVSSVTPPSVLAASTDTSLQIAGSGFIPSSTAQWNGTPISTTYVSASALQATVPAADLAGSSASSITVQNPAPGGGISGAVTFDVNSPTPVVASISPRTVPPGAAATIMITGTGFESNSLAQWNGSPRPTTVSTSTSLQVMLTATDLQNQGSGSLTVNNPAPGASTSAPAQLIVTSQPLPVIQSVNITTGPAVFGLCPQLQVSVTGQNFQSDSTIQANGVSLPIIQYLGILTTITDYLPAGFSSKPGALSFTVTNDGGLVSDPFPYPATNPPVLALCATPSPTTVFANSSFTFTIQPSEVNFSGNATVTLGSLPSGMTTASNSVPLPPNGAVVHVKAANTAAGTYDLTLNGTAGPSTSKGDFNFTVSTAAPPSFVFLPPLGIEIGLSPGGSGSIQFGSLVGGNVDYDVTPSVSGLPPGTTASFSPSIFSVGQSVAVTLNAASSAPITQNAEVTLTGTPLAQTSNSTANFFADVTQPPGSLPGNRTDFVAVAGTPYAAVYDATHNLIFASNPDWNRVDVISNTTHKLLKHIPVRSPRGLDITQDNSHVWVQSASQNVYAIDTVSLQASRYLLPGNKVVSSGLPVSFANDSLLALADGTLFIFFDDSGSGGGGQAAIWNPQTNALKVISSGLITGLGSPVRSGDGTLVYAANDPSYTTGVQVYDVASQTFRTIGSGTGYFNVDAVNQDGSKLVIYSLVGTNLYDSNLTLLGAVPGAVIGIGPLNGGIVFSPDGSKIYEVGTYDNVGAILTMDASTLKVLGAAPASGSEPVGTSGAADTEHPFAIDSTGILLGVQIFGITFDDSTFYQNYVMDQPSSNVGSEYLNVYAGPLAGGTTSGFYAFPSLVPDVWFGQTRGITNINGGELSFTSPPAPTPGPVNIKFIYPDGIQAFFPQLFSYSTFPEYAVTSGSSPSGGGPATVVGYGLPQDASGGTLTVGSNTATITTVAGQYPPFSGEPYPSTILSYTFPPGSPGRADLQINTPIGTGTLPKSIFYAKTVTDYSSTDTFTAVLVDEKRNQLYLAAEDHVDVFSTSSNQFVTSLLPAALGAQKQFTGMALTPDGSQLVVADLLDNSLAVINPDTPTSTYAIPIPAGVAVNQCQVGPLYVATTSSNQAFVTGGSLPAPSCPQSGGVYIANLQAHTSTVAPQCDSGLGVDASGDGNLIVIGAGPCIYNVQNNSYAQDNFPFYYGNLNPAISADGNVLGSDIVLGDLNFNMLGAVAHPIALYGSPSALNPPPLLLRPRLNDSGSLYYFSYPNYFEIIDVQHATLRMRFALTETVQDVAVPLAIDSGGRYVYLITDKGLTIVDFGAAPLSIGHLSTQNAASGAQVVVRGSGFDASVTATVGGVATPVTFTDQNTLTLTIPAATAGPEDIVLTRSDGETYTLENGVVLP